MNQKVVLVPTMKSKIDGDVAWCISLELAWREFEENVLNKNFTYLGDKQVVRDLMFECNKELNVDDKYYFAISGKQTNDLKNKIISALKSKFNTSSDILNNIKFEDNETFKILIYSILMFELSFKKEFIIQHNKMLFGKSKSPISCFGFDEYAESSIKKQVEPLFYNNDNDFAISIFSSDSKQIILYRTDECNNFETTYKRILTNSNHEQRIVANCVSIPNLELDVLQSYNEIIGENFLNHKDRNTFSISNVMQNLKLKLNNKGAIVKSETVIECFKSCYYNPNPIIKKDFIFDNTFYLYIVDNGKPLVATRVENIELYK